MKTASYFTTGLISFALFWYFIIVVTGNLKLFAWIFLLFSIWGFYFWWKIKGV